MASIQIQGARLPIRILTGAAANELGIPRVTRTADGVQVAYPRRIVKTGRKLLSGLFGK